MGSLFFGSISGIYWCFKPFLILTRCRRTGHLPASIRQRKIDLISLDLFFFRSLGFFFVCENTTEATTVRLNMQYFEFCASMWDVTCYYGYRDQRPTMRTALGHCIYVIQSGRCGLHIVSSPPLCCLSLLPPYCITSLFSGSGDSLTSAVFMSASATSNKVVLFEGQPWIT